MPNSWIAPLAAVVLLSWTFSGVAQDAYGQSGGTPALESTEVALELSRSERRQIQMGLAAAGFDPGLADGLFGRNTRSAIRAWQGSRGEAATGYLDADAARELLAAGEDGKAAGDVKQQSRRTSGGRPDLGSEILRDKYVLGLSKALKADDYPKVLAFIDKLERLGGDLPPSIDYFRGEAYLHTKHYSEATKALNRYLSKTGKKGRYYKKSLELILAAEEEAETARLTAETRAKAKSEALAKARTAAHKEITNLAALIRTPYSGSGTAIGTIHGRFRVRYRYRYKVQVKQLSPISIRFVLTNDVRGGVYSETGVYTTSAGYTYTIPAGGIFQRKVFRRKWPEYVRTTVDFAGDFAFAKFGKAPCPGPRSAKCPSRRPYVMHLNGIAIIHEKDHIDEIYDKLVLIRSLMRDAGY